MQPFDEVGGRLSTAHVFNWNKFIEQKLRYMVKQLVCPMELKSWKIDYASHDIHMEGEGLSTGYVYQLEYTILDASL